MDIATPVSLVEQLLDVVKSIEEQTSRSPSGAQQAYEARKNVEALTDRIKRIVLGPQEYTVQLAGVC